MTIETLKFLINTEILDSDVIHVEVEILLNKCYEQNLIKCYKIKFKNRQSTIKCNDYI